MSDRALDLALHQYQRGEFTQALAAARRANHKSSNAEELECLICECLQFQGEFTEALARARTALNRKLGADHTARYWQLIGRTAMDRLQFNEAVEALRKSIRAAEKSPNLLTLASVQQLWLIAAGSTLGNGLGSAVRDAYQTAVRSGEGTALASFHARLARLEAQRGAFGQAGHHLSLAESLLDRVPHTALLALLHVNRACLLSLTGSFELARRSGELGTVLAEQAGHQRLAMAGSASVAYIAISAGDVSIAETWLKKARKAADKLGLAEVGLIETSAVFALLRGDFKVASDSSAQMRRTFDSHELARTNATDASSLFTELYLAKLSENRDGHQKALATMREASDRLQDHHLDVLVTLAEADSLFDDAKYSDAFAKVGGLLEKLPNHLIYLAELNRMLARSLWLSGRQGSAKRALLRASSSALVRGTRLKWLEGLNELRSIQHSDLWEIAYSPGAQYKQADSKFLLLANESRRSWFENTSPPSNEGRDPLDGFDDAVGILGMCGDAELRGREVLASLIALDVVEAAELTIRTDAGLRALASYRWQRPNREDASGELHLSIGRADRNLIEIALKPKRDLRSLYAISGVRRLLEAAKALESQQKDQQRVGALWNPDIVVEEPDAVFSSPQTIELMQAARKIAPTTLPVLLMGDTGTGKEVLARAIHRASGRANKIFLPFNCSAVPRDMIESQLFGSRRGAFTGSHEDLPGIIRSAEGGTLFLDEIGELSMDLQPKLLRFLETNEVHPLGEGKPIKVDVRVIAATNADLDSLIQLKQFREDLYYRLNIVRFIMPQLSERREEIPPLAIHLLRRFEMDEKKHSIKLSDELMEYLLLYKWPGNVRQLSNELRKMVAMVNSGEVLTPEHLAPAIRATRKTVAVDPDAEAVAEADAEPSDAVAQAETAPAAPAALDPSMLAVKLDQPLPGAVEALERAMIEHAMTRADGHIEEAARLLGISRKGLFLKRRRWQNGSDPSHPS